MENRKSKLIQKNLFLNGVGLLLFASTLTLLFTQTGFRSWYLALLVAQIVMAYVRAKKVHVVCLHSARIILGLVFVFSGFVKGVDPVGTQYKIEDYFIAFGMDWAIPYALLLSFVLNMFEFLLGALLLFNIHIKKVLFLFGLMMLFFTNVTFSDALYSPVPDCGCFGDAIKLTNWQTFYKNLLLDALLIVVWRNYKRIDSLFSLTRQNILAVLFIVSFLGMENYSVNHLPFVDFRDWKLGKFMILKDQQPVKYYLTYKNKETGEEKEYLSPNYPYDDSLWVATWEYLDKRIEDPNVPLHEVMITDADGNNITDYVINDEDITLFIAMPSINEEAYESFIALKDEIKEVQKKGVLVCLLTSDSPQKVFDLLDTSKLDIDYYYADDIALKAMVRSNPGFVLLEKGFVKGKWHSNDFKAKKVKLVND